jgi:uncharacterized protein (UPF0305 family)
MFFIDSKNNQEYTNDYAQMVKKLLEHREKEKSLFSENENIPSEYIPFVKGNPLIESDHIKSNSCLKMKNWFSFGRTW